MSPNQSGGNMVFILSATIFLGNLFNRSLWSYTLQEQSLSVVDVWLTIRNLILHKVEIHMVGLIKGHFWHDIPFQL